MQLCELWKVVQMILFVTNTFVNVFVHTLMNVDTLHRHLFYDLLNEMCRKHIYEENHLQNSLYVNCHIELHSDSLNSKDLHRNVFVTQNFFFQIFLFINVT